MRTLLRIIEAIKDGERPTYEELYWTVLALDALWQLDRRSLRETTTGQYKDNHHMRRWAGEESFRRCKSALGVPPDKYMASRDPDSPEYQRWRRFAKKIMERVEEGGADDG